MLKITLGVLMMLLCISYDMYGKTTAQEQELKRRMDSAMVFSVVRPDSVFRVMKMYHKEAVDLEGKSLSVQSFLALSELSKILQNYSLAFDYAGEALFLAEELSDTLLLAKSCAAFGVLNYMFYQKEEAERYLKKALMLNKIVLEKERISLHDLIASYFDMVLFSRQFKNYDLALGYLDSCYIISDTIAHGAVNRAYLDVERGNTLSSQNRIDEAIEELSKAAVVFERISSNEKQIIEKGYLVVIYSYIGDLYRKKGEVARARLFFKKAMNALHIDKRHMTQKPFILERFSWLQFAQGEYKQAYEKLNEASRLNEKYFSAKTLANSDFLTVRNLYREKLLSKNKELGAKNLELIEKGKAIFRFRLLFVALILVLIIGGLMVKNWWQNKKHEKEKEASERKQRKAKGLLEQKNKELTASTLKLIEKEETIRMLSDHLKASSTGSSTTAILATVKNGNSSLWEDFNSRFIAVNNDFYDKLVAQVPELSPGDLKICALIKLNFSGKEMAQLLGISVDSVHKARHRLRKKLQLDRDVNLTGFISSI